MKVFVTGASGFIGSAVAREFARSGQRVLGLVRGDASARSLERDEIEPVRGTLQEVGAWKARAEECAVIAHCAFDYAGGGFAVEQQALTEMLALGVPGFVYTSGVWVYGDTGGARVDETHAPRPVKLVARRLESEKLVLAASRDGVRTCVVRPGVVYGASGSLTSAWFAGAAEKQVVRFVGSGEQRWAMVHREDLARLYVRIAEARVGGEVFNAVGSHATVGECVRAVARVAGASVERMKDEEKLGGLVEALSLSQCVDASKAERVVGWRGRHPGFVEGVDVLWRAWRAGREMKGNGE